MSNKPDEVFTINGNDLQNQPNEKEPNGAVSSNKRSEIGDFIIGDKLGEGTFSKVCQGVHKITNEKVAIKIMAKSQIKDNSDRLRIEKEISIQKRLHHVSIIQQYCVIETRSTIYIVTEYCSGGELFDHIVTNRRLYENEACRIFQQLLAGLEYLHKQRIVHRDLKPENLLFNSKRELKIADFGLSTDYTGKLGTPCGSPCYAAPEMVIGKKYNGSSVDIWSSGIVLYTMVCGFLPFEDQNQTLLFGKIAKGIFQLPTFLSPPCKDLLKNILITDPAKRYTFEQIKHHPWFLSVNNIMGKNIFFASPGLFISEMVIPIDEEIVDDLITLYHYDLRHVVNAVLRNKHNEITTSYYLLLKKKLRNGYKSISDTSSSSELFLQYLRLNLSKLVYFANDINTIIAYYYKKLKHNLIDKDKPEVTEGMEEEKNGGEYMVTYDQTQTLNTIGNYVIQDSNTINTEANIPSGKDKNDIMRVVNPIREIEIAVTEPAVLSKEIKQMNKPDKINKFINKPFTQNLANAIMQTEANHESRHMNIHSIEDNSHKYSAKMSNIIEEVSSILPTEPVPYPNNKALRNLHSSGDQSIKPHMKHQHHKSMDAKDNKDIKPKKVANVPSKQISSRRKEDDKITILKSTEDAKIQKKKNAIRYIRQKVAKVVKEPNDSQIEKLDQPISNRLSTQYQHQSAALNNKRFQRDTVPSSQYRKQNSMSQCHKSMNNTISISGNTSIISTIINGGPPLKSVSPFLMKNSNRRYLNTSVIRSKDIKHHDRSISPLLESVNGEESDYLKTHKFMEKNVQRHNLRNNRKLMPNHNKQSHYSQDEGMIKKDMEVACGKERGHSYIRNTINKDKEKLKQSTIESIPRNIKEEILMTQKNNKGRMNESDIKPKHKSNNLSSTITPKKSTNTTSIINSSIGKIANESMSVKEINASEKKQQRCISLPKNQMHMGMTMKESSSSSSANHRSQIQNTHNNNTSRTHYSNSLAKKGKGQMTICCKKPLKSIKDILSTINIQTLKVSKPNQFSSTIQDIQIVLECKYITKIQIFHFMLDIHKLNDFKDYCIITPRLLKGNTWAFKAVFDKIKTKILSTG